MTNKEILQADMLDILFEHRNKLYGAYALRKTYNHRLAVALAAALSTGLLFVLMSLMKKDNDKNNFLTNDPVMKLTEVNIPKPEDPEPLKQKPEIKTQTAQADYQRIIVVPDDKADTMIADINDIRDADIGKENIKGDKSDGLAKTATDSNGSGDGSNKEPEKKNEFTIDERPPAFPGGTQAWLAFLQRYLQSPEDLEPGQRIEVRVRFWVDIDGSVSKPEIIKSGGAAFDKEVLRVMKKMSRWEPAVQNGNHIAVAYTQPVTFIGAEQ